MAKITLSDQANLQNETTAVAVIAANNRLIEAAMEKTLSRDGTTPNQMAVALDMNSYGIINLPIATLPTHPVRLQEVGDAPTYAAAALASQVAAAASEAAADLDAVAAAAAVASTAADAVATAADAVATGLDVIATAADAATTAADRVQTGLDAVATAADRVQTGLDLVATTADAVSTAADAAATAADSVATGLDAVATAADRVQTALDAAATAADVLLTNADVVSTGLDAVATAADAVATAADNAATGADAIATAADRVQTGLDAAATAADNVATGLDAIATAADAVSTAADAASTAANVANLTGTSTTSLAIAVASKVFTTQAGKFFTAGTWLLATSDADPTNFMHGQVTSYTSTTLTLNVTNVGGSGTYADWTITVAGTRGSTGPSGSLDFGAIGDVAVASGDYLAFGDITDTNNTARTTVAAVTSAALTAVPATVAQGGTNSTTASDARTALGLAIGTDVQAYDATYVVDADIGVTVQPYDATYVVDADIGVTVQAYDATYVVGADIGSTVQAYDATYVVDADIGSTVQAYDVDTAKLDVAQTWAAVQGYTPTVLTFSATPTWDVDTKPFATLAMTASITSFAVSGVVAGRFYVLKVTQDTSARTIAYTAANFKFVGGAAPTLSTGSGAVDYYVFVGLSSTVLHEISRTQAVA